MERLREVPAAGSETRCAGCGAHLASSRCEQCGVAARAGPYRVLRLLAQSPHGRMYLAEDEAGAQVALKELIFALVPSTKELDAFEREAAMLRQLDHPRIPRLLRGFVEGRGASMRLYLAQQYIAGESLAQRLEHHRFDEDEVARIAEEVLEILVWLHGRAPPVLHRDLKPGNLIVDGQGRVHLVDFGSARDLAGAATHRSTLVGTFGYMPPEQLGGTVEPRSDLYALGATLVHLLTREGPEKWLGPGLSVEVRGKLSTSAFLERFVSKLAAPRAGDRFASASAALKALRGSAMPAASPRRLVGLAAAVALAVGGLGLVLRSEAPVRALPADRAAPAPAREVVQPPPVVEPLPDEPIPGEPPPPGKITFDWKRAQWRFDRPGHWLLDESGRGHHLPLPTRGYTTDFFGLVWDGTAGLSVPDHADFAPKGAFTIQAQFMLPEKPNLRPAVLVARGDPAARFAWALTLEPRRVLRFSIAGEDGRVSTVEGALKDQKGGRSSISIHASFDPATGEQRLDGECRVIGKTNTTVRPAASLPGARIHLLSGYEGNFTSIELMNGLMLPTGKPGSCSYSGSKLNDRGE